MFDKTGQSHSCYGLHPFTLSDAFAGFREHWLPLYLELKERSMQKTGVFTEFFPSVGVMWKHPTTFAMVRCKKQAMEIEFYSHKQQPDRNPVRYLKNSKYRIAHIIEVKDNSDFERITDWILESYQLTLKKNDNHKTSQQ
jgi:hypothetical protein